MRRMLTALIALAALLFVAPGGANAQTEPATGGTLRVIHAVEGGPGVDIYVDGQVALNSRDFFSEWKLPLTPGDHEVLVVRDGETQANALVGKRIAVEPGDTYTLTLIGSADNLRGLLLKDRSSAAQADQARLRIIHAAAGQGALDVAVAKGEPFLKGAAFGSVNYIKVPSGTYALDLTAAGTGADVLRTVELTFTPGWSYTLVVTGDTPANVWVQVLVDRMGS